MLLYESKLWLTQKNTVRKSDLDNRVKPTLDIMSLALGIDDKLAWEIHAYKAASHQERTHFYIFDLGDVIQYTQRNGEN